MLKGKSALVTGGNRGIGLAIALELAKNGADISIIYNGDEQSATLAVEEIKKNGVKAQMYKCNVADFNETKVTIDKVIAEFGGVDILINNAGITRDGLVFNMSEANFDDVISTNLKGAFNTSRHLYQNFVRKKSGRIINISSVSGVAGNAGQANYSSAKAGLIGLTKSLAKELAPRGITCNAVAPGFIKTDMTDVIAESAKEKILEKIPLRRMGEASEVAKLVGFLSSDSASYITGEVIKVDGGMFI